MGAACYVWMGLNFCKPLKKIQKVVRLTRSPRQQWPPRRTKNGDFSIVFFSRVGLRTYQHPCTTGGKIPTGEIRCTGSKNFYFVHHTFPMDEMCKEMYVEYFIYIFFVFVQLKRTGACQKILVVLENIKFHKIWSRVLGFGCGEANWHRFTTFIFKSILRLQADRQVESNVCCCL